METFKPGQLFLRLLIPLLWAIALHLSPRPAAYDAALQSAWQARALGDSCPGKSGAAVGAGFRA